MSQYTADPRKEELQLLRQLLRGPVTTKAIATYDVAKRLEAKGESMGWWNIDATYHIEITATGKKNAEGTAG